MSVTEYKNIECKYRIDKLDNVVYLVPENALRNIHIDASEAYVDNIPFEPLRIDCYNIALSDTDEFDERYKFTHQLTFSVNGYANHNTLDGNYYAIVRSVDNEYWLVNPMFPCKVTYTYKLGYMENHTDFTLSTISNHPTLRIHGMNQGKPFICHDYFLNSIDRLFLNEKRYCTHVGSQIYYTNDGFKEVVYDKKSASFTETFDGKNVSHSIQFNIKFDDYKDSWHYNLLEFTDNLYSAVITSTKGEYVLCGFHFGLQPSYTVTSNGESAPDYIQINLVDMHDNGDLITYITGGTISPITTTEYKYTLEYDAWECVSDGYAQYLLKKEVDALDNPTGSYMCLEGYEEQFAFLGEQLVGTFDETDTFFQPQCKIGECKLYTSLTSLVKMFAQQCKLFSVKADSDWSITNNASYLQFTPSSGEANTEYSVSLCNFREQSAATVTTSFTINYCSTSSTYNVQIGKGSGCFYGGDEFNISPDAQYVVVPVECCVSAASETTSALTNIQIFDNYIRVYVPQNTSESARTFTLDVTLCDSTGEIVTINQANGYERWVTEGYTCIGKLKCEVQRKYTGTTSGDINTWTEVVRTYGCIPSSECGGSMTRWVDTEDTVCYEGRKYIVQIEQVKPSTDSPWINTGNQRRGDETPDSPAECSGTTLEEWRVDTSEYICDDTTKYEMMRLYVSYDSGTTWTATDTTKKGVVIEHDSEDCGYVPPSGQTIYEWRVEGTDCDGFDLYYWEQKYVSDDDGNTWSPTGTYRYGSLIEQNSSQCGYVPPIVYEYQWVLSSGTTCIGYDKYYLYKKQQRPSGSSETWVDVVPTTTSVDGSGTETPVLAQSASTDCGYVPPIEPQYRWTATTGYMCSGTSKMTKEVYQVSYDSGSTWQNVVPEQTRAALPIIESASTDCGYYVVYKWEDVSGEYTCSGCTKYQKTQKFISTDGGTTWEAVSPAEYGLGDVIEQGSEYCGCSTQYRWYTLPSTQYICSGYTKYYKEVYQVSYDSGSTWANVVPEQTRMGAVIESASTDCGYSGIIYKWDIDPNDYYVCEGTTKYELFKEYYSIDGGITWNETGETRRGVVIEHDSEDCGYVPPTPTGYSEQYLTFIPTTASSTFSFSKSIQYSLDSGETWSWLAANTDSPSVSARQKIMWKGNLVPEQLNGIGTFTGRTYYEIEGNPMSLLYSDNFIGQTSLSGKDYAFAKLFLWNEKVVNTERMVLPATTLSYACYNAMFYGCTAMTKSMSSLPATTLAERCYSSMFQSCSSLTSTITSLPATTLANYCYSNMFEDCTSLTTAMSILPATTLAQNCYSGMFQRCTSLTTAPELPATTLAQSCYNGMFQGCTSLTTAPQLLATKLERTCYFAMFDGCSSLNRIVCLATNRSAFNCTKIWVRGVSSSGTFTKASSMTSWPTGEDGIPSGWTVTNYTS